MKLTRLLLASALVSGSLLSSPACAADKAAQAQIETQRTQLKSALKDVKPGGIEKELKALIARMNVDLDRLTEIAAMEVPADLAQHHDGGLSPGVAISRIATRDAFVADMDRKVADLDSKFSIETGQHQIQILALQLANYPESPERSMQTKALILAATLSQQQQAIATNLLRNKKADLLAELEKADEAAETGVYQCIMSGKCG